MKCIKKHGVIKRVKDSEAIKAVNEGWEYCPKSEWKKEVRDAKKK